MNCFFFFKNSFSLEFKSIKGYNVMKDCSKKITSACKKNAKQRMHFSLKKIEEIKLYLNNTLSEEHYTFFQNVTDNSTEK